MLVRRRTHPALLALCAATLALTGAQQAQAAPTLFFGQDFVSGYPPPPGSFPNAEQAEANFFAALNPGTVSTQDFEAFTGLNPTFTLPGAGISATTENFNARSGFQVEGERGLSNEGGTGTSFGVINFSTELSALGFFVTDAGTLRNSPLFLRFENSGNAGFTQTIPVNNATADQAGGVGPNVLYFGIIDTAMPFDRVTFVRENIVDGVTVDNLSVGQPAATSTNAIPEPGTWALLVSGLLPLLGYGLGRHYRRRQQLSSDSSQ